VGKIYEKKTLETHKSKRTKKTKMGKRNVFLILIQIQNKLKITTIQIKRKNILTKDEDENIGIHGQHEIQDEDIQGI